MTEKPKRPKDANQLAKSVVDIATGEGKTFEESDRESVKNPAAVELGRLGGKKGGRARAQKLSPQERAAIARKAARERWKYKDDS